jgi:cytochrome c
MRRAGFVWNEATLDRFLRSPLKAVPGTSMGYDGIKDDGERRDLILFLREAGRAANCQDLPAGAARLP